MALISFDLIEYRGSSSARTGALLIAGPVGGVAVAGTTALFAVNYERKFKNRLKELIKKHSRKPYSEDKIETFA